MGYLHLAIFALTGSLLAMGGMLISRFLFHRKRGVTDSAPYECGEKTIGTAWVQFRVGYYVFALIFLIFEVETLFLFPCALVLKSIGMVALLEVGAFVALLALGLLYVWRKGGLEWE